MLLDTIAVGCTQTELWLLEALASDCLKYLEECLSSGMLTSAPLGVAFRHAQYARALRFGDRLPAAERAQLLGDRSRACYLTDHYDEGIAALEQALECHRTLGDTLKQGDALRRLSEFFWCPGRTAEAEQSARDAVALLESLPPGRELAIAYVNLGSCWSAPRSNAAAIPLPTSTWSRDSHTALSEASSSTGSTCSLIAHACSSSRRYGGLAAAGRGMEARRADRRVAEAGSRCGRAGRGSVAGRAARSGRARL
jgi:tetratricopeptide (TPR) repeat protein